MTQNEMAEILEQATRALEQATQRIKELVRERDDAVALYKAIAAERDHWYSVSVRGGNA
jgi:hypothetical protein